ncbi:MAG TPA: condensation domain-containing protein, partial [Longimicrobiales bacterium]|nr:condensation domain-containing protein [Longimicrobiales bacterium]
MSSTVSTSLSGGGLEIPRRGEGGPAPLSFAQELLWLMDRAAPGVTAWNVPRAFRVRGPLDVDALQRAVDALVARHEVLRTTFGGPEGAPRQTVRPAGPVPVRFVDVAGEPAERRAARVDELVREHARASFDLSADLLLRVMLVRLADDDHVLCLNTHHIVSDGWSKSIMFRELSALYAGFRAGRATELPPLPIQFADYAAWERDALHEAALADSLAYWREQLGGVLPTLALPTDYPRPSAPGFGGGARVAILPRALLDAVAALAREHDTTLYMALLAAYATLLHRYTSQDEIVVGSPIAGRMQSETEGLIGYFANTLVLRTSLAGDPTFAELLGRVRETCLGAYEHQEVPFEKLVLELQKGQSLTHAPLFQVVLTMEDTIPAALELEATSLEPIDSDHGSTKFDLTLLVAILPEGLRLTLGYRTDLFRGETAERALGHLRRVLEGAVADPGRRVSELELLTEPEAAELEAWGVAAGAAADRAAGTWVHERVSEWAQRTPEAVAVVEGARVVCYQELDARASALAARLRRRGVEAGEVVGVGLERSVEAVVALLGVMKAGAAYVPLSPELPEARLRQLVAEAGARVVVVASEHAARVAGLEVVTLEASAADTAAAAGSTASSPEAGAVAGADAAPRPRAGSPAYVLFTSGSTGVPKGVAVTHANLAGYVDAILERLGWDAGEARSFGWV